MPLLEFTSKGIYCSQAGVYLDPWKGVDKALISIDTEKTQCATLADLADKFSSDYELYFANGGDQNNDSIPEVSVCKEKGIGLIEGLGDKIQSSSWLLKK